MTYSEYTLESQPMSVRPECPDCTVPMYLSRVTPDKKLGFDLRTFGCPRCQNTLRAVMKLN
jgi:hypothetical protein